MYIKQILACFISLNHYSDLWNKVQEQIVVGGKEYVRSEYNLNLFGFKVQDDLAVLTWSSSFNR